MNSFEAVVAKMLQRAGFWVWPLYKVALTRDEKARIGRSTSPRWEIDIVGYKAASNTLRLVECKSYLDSAGVRMRDFNSTGEFGAARYKIFNDQTLRTAVIERAVAQLVAAGSILPAPTIQLCLAVGKFKSRSDHLNIAAYFESMDWILIDPQSIGASIRQSVAAGYDDDVGSIVAKLLAAVPSPQADG